ncbi:hypothetical protein O7635_36470 [Asanoa sp. WMMD1127]|uniref:hypothetical protein n=1 Tax=Asanoa sp. WMMD1127 TaxID=3016107 RepID=UPI0024174B4F|nr:hypothetical protein [Asanoa sp. WMMD1127]MDG4827371.1 hypothetical protein [Asanoa sp. WMMD1127]
MDGAHGFRALWAAYSVTLSGSAIALGALPFLAVTQAGAGPAEVAAMAAVAAVASAVIALPLAPAVDRLPKRRVLMATEWA